MAIGQFAYASSTQRFMACAPLADQPFASSGVPFDGVVTNRPGARFGPQAIRTASLMLCDGTHPVFDVSPLAHLGDALDMRLPNASPLPEVRRHIEAQAAARLDPAGIDALMQAEPHEQRFPRPVARRQRFLLHHRRHHRTFYPGNTYASSTTQHYREAETRRKLLRRPQQPHQINYNKTIYHSIHPRLARRAAAARGLRSAAPAAARSRHGIRAVGPVPARTDHRPYGRDRPAPPAATSPARRGSGSGRESYRQPRSSVIPHPQSYPQPERALIT